MINSFEIGCSVGALLYCPANSHSNIVESIVNEKFSTPYSLAFCLEDTIRENEVEDAEKQLYTTLSKLQDAQKEVQFYMPKIFVRVRTPEQLQKLMDIYQCFRSVLTGFILPKFYLSNCDQYILCIRRELKSTESPFWFMPIMEAHDMIPLNQRIDGLTELKKRLDSVKNRILNVRVGANDLSHAFGLRRHADNTIYDLRPVASLLEDIVTTFSQDYVVSGPVWEYYAGPGWRRGLQRELEMDLLNGFLGKTVIHPKQITVVNHALKVEQKDYDDANAILGWSKEQRGLVSASTDSSRMNEYNTHYFWAHKILILAETYGIK